ncbi:MAG: caspase family protein [Bacteroidota bacterium]
MRLWFLSLLFLHTMALAQPQDVATVVQKGHIQSVSVIAWHPSGNYFASGSADHSIILWDYHSGKQIRTFNQHTGKIIDLKFSKNGEWLLSAGSDNLVAIMDCQSGNEVFTYVYNEPHAYPMSVAFSPREDYVFIGDNRDQFTQVKISDQQKSVQRKGFSAPIRTASWSNEQTKSLIIDSYKGVQLVDRKKNDTLFMAFDKPYDYAFNSSKNYVALGSNKLKASIFDTERGTLIHQFEAEQQCDGCKMKIAFSKAGDLFATFARDEGLSVYKTKNWKKIFDFTGLSAADNIQFSRDGDWISIKTDNNYTHINLTTGNHFATSSKDQKHIKSTIHPKLPVQLVANDVFGITAKKVTSNKAIKTFGGLLNDKKQQVESLDYASWYNKNIINHLKLKPAAALDESGQYLAIGKVDTSVVIQNLDDGSFLPRFIHHTSPIFSVVFHPSQPLLLTGDAEGNVKFWNYETHRLLFQFKPHVRYILDLAFNASGDELITSSWDGTINHWKVKVSKSTETQLIDHIDLQNNSGFSVGFSPRNLYLAVGDVKKNMRLYEADTKTYIDKFKGHARTISDFCFFNVNNQQRLATVSRDGWLKIWDFNSGTLLDKFAAPNKRAMLSISHHPDRNLLIVGNTNRHIYGYNYISCQLEFDVEAHPSGVNWVKWNAPANELLSRSVTGEIKHWKIDSNVVQLNYTLHVIDRDEWLLMAPNGQFDGTQKSMQYINYVKGWNSLEIDLFFDKYYTPKLFEQLAAAEPMEDRGLNEMMKEIPTFELKMETFQGDRIAVNPDSTYQHSTSELLLSVNYAASKADLQSIAVFNNDKRSATIEFDSAPLFRGINKEKSFSVDLAPGHNDLRLELMTKDGLRSASRTLHVQYDTLMGKRELFIVAVGIDKYDNSNYNLNYAKNDAKSFINELSSNAEMLFETVHTHSLYNKSANKTDLRETIRSLKTEIGPEDAFVFYYAGHGVMIPYPQKDASTFFLVMSDITNMYGDFSKMSQKGFSGDELFQLAKNIPAQKQLFIIDACQSGGALQAGNFRGVEREKAIAKLARSSGTFFITASREMEYANESSDLEHGIFTYALLEMMNPENTISPAFSPDAIISASELKSYVESRVPELSQQYKGSTQYPTGYSFGNDFPLIERK